MDSIHGSTRVVFRTNPQEIGDFFLYYFVYSKTFNIFGV